MKTKLQFLQFAVFLFSFATIQAQTLGEFKPQDGGYKAKNVTDGSKKMYVASFTINFEIYKEAVDEKKAGGFGRTVKNAAKAKAAVGLSTLDKEAIQAIRITVPRRPETIVRVAPSKPDSTLDTHQSGEPSAYLLPSSCKASAKNGKVRDK